MLAKLHTFSLLGIEAVPVDVEVDLSAAAILKNMLVGLPEAAVKESTHRVERAIVNSGFQRPHDRVLVNLAPAELPHQAASFDLPITSGVLGGQRTTHLQTVRRVWGRGRVVARGSHAARQGRAVDGHFSHHTTGAPRIGHIYDGILRQSHVTRPPVTRHLCQGLTLQP